MVEIGLYKHKKGGLYIVSDVAIHSETKESLVIYRCMDSNIVYARPVDMFLDGRFKKIDFSEAF